MVDIQRLNSLSSQMDLEPSEDLECRPQLNQGKDDLIIYHATLPGGKRIPLVKSLLTSACERNCYYCPFRAGRDFRRETFKPDEFASTFLKVAQSGAAKGVFLSSGIAGGGIRTQDQLIDTAEILRHKYHYHGYLHLKIMPGAEFDQVERAMQLADRVSINLEAPNNERLERLAPRKQFFEELWKPLQWVHQIRQQESPTKKAWNGSWPSLVTQFVVGGAQESDVELLSTTSALFQHLKLRRVYYSLFRPVAETPLEGVPPEDPSRGRRLYQASFLLRDYGFTFEDFSFDPQGRLPLSQDPKLTRAQKHLTEQPIEINRAGREELLRIPGIGPAGVRTILQSRCQGRFSSLEELARVGIQVKRAAPFILINGSRQAYQTSFW